MTARISEMLVEDGQPVRCQLLPVRGVDRGAIQHRRGEVVDRVEQDQPEDAHRAARRVAALTPVLADRVECQQDRGHGHDRHGHRRRLRVQQHVADACHVNEVEPPTEDREHQVVVEHGQVDELADADQPLVHGDVLLIEDGRPVMEQVVLAGK